MADLESQEDEIQVLQSIFTGEEFHSGRQDSLICGQFNAYVSVPEGFVIIDRDRRWQPERVTDKDDPGDSSESNDTVLLKKVATVNHLPPVELCFTLPSDYPSQSSPKYTIMCHWLTFSQLRDICKRLDQIWQENKGFVVLYSWAQFLKDECLSFLKIENSLDVEAVERDAIAFEAKKRKTPKRAPIRITDGDVSAVVKKRGKEEEEANRIRLSLVESVSSPVSLYPHHVRVEDAIAEDDALKIKRSLYDANPNASSWQDWQALDSGKTIERGDVETSETWRRPICAGDFAPGPSGSSTWKREGSSGRWRWRWNPGRSNARDNRKRYQRKNNVPRKFVGIIIKGGVFTEPLWDIIMEHNKLKKRKDFDFQICSCAICYEEKLGSQCMELDNCSHVFCRECLTSYLNVSINDGKVRQLTCPERDCDTEFLQSEIKSLVTPELFAKYDSLLLATTLDTLNVIYCPRKFCQYPVSPESENMARCPQCHYCFCLYCKMVYHGVESCRFKLDSQQTKALIAEYENCCESRKTELERIYGRKHLRQLVDRALSETWISSNSKQCPKCNSSIERTHGCNKMVCLRCNTPFCWLCFEILNPVDPYAHYQVGRCANKLFLGTTSEEEEDDEQFFEDEDQFGFEDPLDFLDEDFDDVYELADVNLVPYVRAE